MSRMAQLKRMRGVGGDPAILGAIAGFLGKKILPAAGKLLGIGKKALPVASGITAGSMLPAVVKKGGALVAGGATMGAGMSLAEQAMAGIGGAGGYRKRRAKGITGAELRGFHKVAGLLRKVGMVPRGTRTSRRRGR